MHQTARRKFERIRYDNPSYRQFLVDQNTHKNRQKQ